MVFRLISSLSRMAMSRNLRKSSPSLMKYQTIFSPVCSKKTSFEFGDWNNKSLLDMTRHFASVSPDIATYEEVKQLPAKPNVLLIDVREPQELLETGKRLKLSYQDETFCLFFRNCTNFHKYSSWVLFFLPWYQRFWQILIFKLVKSNRNFLQNFPRTNSKR